MSREKPRSEGEARHWRTVEIIERAMANEELMEATRDGVQETLLGIAGADLLRRRRDLLRSD